MKTKTKPAKKSAARKPLPAPLPAAPVEIEIAVHPRHVHFFRAGEAEPYSKMRNGAVGSADREDAWGVIVETCMEHKCNVRQFDANGVEIPLV
jgi:hypothetical protein